MCHSRDHIQDFNRNSIQIGKLKFYLTDSCGFSADKSGTSVLWSGEFFKFNLFLFLRLSFNYNVSLLTFSLQTFPKTPPCSSSSTWSFFSVVLLLARWYALVHTHTFLNVTSWFHTLLVCVIPELMSWHWMTNWCALPCGEPTSPSLSVGPRPHGLSSSRLACLLVSCLFSSLLGGHFGEALWV